jgi:Family of unknown function (DUF6350)
VFLPPWDAVTHASEPATTSARPSGVPRPPGAPGTPGAPGAPGAPGSPGASRTAEPHARWAAVRVSAIAGGVAAAGLGLGGIAAVVLLLWIGSPFPDSGLGGALHISAGLWLLAQGAELVRNDTLSGDPAPVALAPLLLSTLPAWLIFRGTASAVSATADGDDEDPYDLRTAALVSGWVLAGYLTLAAVAAVYASRGPVHIDPLSALYVPLFAACAAACGAWSGCGRPGPARWLPGPWRGYGDELGAALRAAAIAAGMLLCGGALIGAASLVWHAGPVGQTYAQLSGPVSGRISVLLLALGLVPNLAVWAASYALGVGFQVGAGSLVAPAEASGHVVLPGFPLLAALPGAGGSWIGWTTLAVPGVAALAVAWLVGNGGRPPWATVRVVTGAAIALGGGFAVLAARSGGALGTHTLAEFGPAWWRAGAAALVWTLVIAVPVSLVLRYRLAHPPTPWRTLLRSLRLPRLPRLPRVPRFSQVLPRPRLPRLYGMPRMPGLLRRRADPDPGTDTEKLIVSASGTPASVAAAARTAAPVPAAPGASGTSAVAAATPFPGLLPPSSDPLPWPSPPPLPLFPPPLPDLPPSAPPPPAQDPLPADPPASPPPVDPPPARQPPVQPPPVEPPPVKQEPAEEPPVKDSAPPSAESAPTDEPPRAESPGEEPPTDEPSTDEPPAAEGD